jgi:hypothetical protein
MSGFIKCLFTYMNILFIIIRELNLEASPLCSAQEIEMTDY